MSKANVLQTNPMQTSTIPNENQSQRGQALVEFALVLLFIILPFTFVLVDGAIMLFTYAEVTNAAREAARAASIYQCGSASVTCSLNPTDTLDQQAASIHTARLAYVDQYFNAEDRRWLSALIGYGQCARDIGYPAPLVMGNPYRELDPLTVTLACPRRLLFGLVGTGSITLTARSTMRIEPGGVTP